MIYSHLFLLIGVGILCHFVPRISGHAYFMYPTPRNVYCTNASCTSNGTSGRQGPVWGLTANSTLDAVSPSSQTTCNGSVVLDNARAGDTYDPGFKGATSASWPAGSSQTLQIFVSHIHPTEGQGILPTDGWQIRYRDGTQPNSTFSPIAFIYVNVSTTASTGPYSAIGFQLGQIVLATITVPKNPTSDGIFQFYWRNHAVNTGAMWLSCADVTITSPSTTTLSTTTLSTTTLSTTTLSTTTLSTTTLSTTTLSTTTYLGTITVSSAFAIVFAALWLLLMRHSICKTIIMYTSKKL